MNGVPTFNTRILGYRGISMRVYYAPANDPKRVYRLVWDHASGGDASIPIPHNPSSPFGCSNLVLKVDNLFHPTYDSNVWACFGYEMLSGADHYQEATEDEWNVFKYDEKTSVLTDGYHAVSTDYPYNQHTLSLDRNALFERRCEVLSKHPYVQLGPLELHCFMEMRP